MKIFLLLLSCILLLSITLSAQSKKIKADEFNLIYNQALKNVEQKTRTEKKTIEVAVSKKVISKINITTEFFSPDKSRTMFVKNSPDPIEKIETIVIGDEVYRRENNGKWNKSKYKAGKDNNSIIESPKNFFDVKYTLEKPKIGNKNFKLLIVRGINSDNDNEQQVKILIDEAGLISRIKKVFGTNIIITSEFTTFDYNISDIKIEAPIE